MSLDRPGTLAHVFYESLPAKSLQNAGISLFFLGWYGLFRMLWDFLRFGSYKV